MQMHTLLVHSYLSVYCQWLSQKLVARPFTSETCGQARARIHFVRRLVVSGAFRMPVNKSHLNEVGLRPFVKPTIRKPNCNVPNRSDQACFY